MNKLLRVIATENPPIKWSHRSFLSPSRKNDIINKIMNILEFISGNDMENMLNELLNKKSLKLSKYTRESVAFKKILPHFNDKIKQKSKHYFVKALRDSNFKRHELRKEFGFKFSDFLWESSQNDRQRETGGRKLNEEWKEKFNNFLKRNSEIAASRTVTKFSHNKFIIKKNFVKKYAKKSSTKEIKNSNYIKNTLTELHREFKDNNQTLPGERFPSKRSFFRYKNNEFKRARRMTDLCDYCELSIVLKNKINIYVANNFPDLYNENFDLKNYLDFFKKDIRQPPNLTEEHEYESDDADESKAPNDTRINPQNISNQLELIRLINFHQEMAEKQRILYNKMTTEPIHYNDSIMIEMDFKQKIVFGLGPRQISSDYYRLKQCSLLGFGIYFLKTFETSPGNDIPWVNNGKVSCIRVDIFSDSTDQDGEHVVRSFRFLREQEFFKNIEKKNINVFCDAGAHFKNKVVAHYFFDELWNQERHGKSNCDVHFSAVNKFLKNGINLSKLENVDDVISCVESGQLTANLNNEKKERRLIVLHCFKVNPVQTSGRKENQMLPKLDIMVIPYLKSYYNLHMSGDNILKSAIYGSSNKSYPLFLGGSKPTPIEPNFRYEGAKNVTRKYLNILKNIGQKEAMALKLTRPHTTQLDSSQNSSSNQNVFLQIQETIQGPIIQGTNPRFINNNLPVPKFCIYDYDCQNCMAPVQFNNEEIKKIKQSEINEELKRHGHKSSLRIQKRNGKKKEYRNTEEGRKELLEHYNKFHPSASTTNNANQPNTSNNLQ